MVTWWEQWCDKAAQTTMTSSVLTANQFQALLGPEAPNKRPMMSVSVNDGAGFMACHMKICTKRKVDKSEKWLQKTEEVGEDR